MQQLETKTQARNVYMEIAEWWVRKRFIEVGIDAVPENLRCAIAPVGRKKTDCASPGECWQPQQSSDGHFECAIHLVEHDALGLLTAIAHQFLHAALNTTKHDRHFLWAAEKLGLKRPPVRTPAGPEFKAWAAKFVAEHGEPPFGRLKGKGPDHGPKRPKPNRERTLVCPGCGEVKLRIDARNLNRALTISAGCCNLPLVSKGQIEDLFLAQPDDEPIDVPILPNDVRLTLPPLIHDGKQRFRVILADPPWDYGTNPGHRAALNQYDTMTIERLKDIPVADWAEDDAVLFMWVTERVRYASEPIWKTWGFEFRAKGFEWVKLNRGGQGVFLGMGNYTRSATESCLIGVRGKGLERMDKSISEVILSPVREHSRKPDEAYSRIEKMYGGPYLELFSRSDRAGWAHWGTEVGKFASAA